MLFSTLVGSPEKKQGVGAKGPQQVVATSDNLTVHILVVIVIYFK